MLLKKEVAEIFENEAYHQFATSGCANLKLTRKRGLC